MLTGNRSAQDTQVDLDERPGTDRRGVSHGLSRVGVDFDGVHPDATCQCTQAGNQKSRHDANLLAFRSWYLPDDWHWQCNHYQICDDRENVGRIKERRDVDTFSRCARSPVLIHRYALHGENDDGGDEVQHDYGKQSQTRMPEPTTKLIAWEHR